MTCWLPESAWLHEAAAHKAKGSSQSEVITACELAEGGEGGLIRNPCLGILVVQEHSLLTHAHLPSHVSLEELDRPASGDMIPAIELPHTCNHEHSIHMFYS